MGSRLLALSNLINDHVLNLGGLNFVINACSLIYEKKRVKELCLDVLIPLINLFYRMECNPANVKAGLVTEAL